MAYAQQLEEDLRRIGFRCFLDFKEMPAGEVLTASLRNSLKRSSSLVLVVSAGALLHSHYMPREFDYYIGARRSPKIVPISIGRALDESGTGRAAQPARAGPSRCDLDFGTRGATDQRSVSRGAQGAD